MLVERRENLLAVEAERIEQRRHRNLAAAVDTRIDDVFRVELDVEPRAAIRNDAGREQKLARGMGLALVVIEEHAGRAVHLRNDHALGAVDDEGAVVGHERNVAHVDILLLDVLDRTRAGLLVDIEDDEAQRHLERRGVSHAALTALVDVVFRRLEFVFDELELRRIGKIGNREDRFEDGLQALVGTPADGLLHQQELVIRCLLNLDEVRHLRHFFDFPEKLPYALATGKRLRHLFLSRFDFGGRRGRLSEQPQSIATIRTGVGAVRFYVIRAWPEPPHTTFRRDRSFGSRPSSCPRPPGRSPGDFVFVRPPVSLRSGDFA